MHARIGARATRWTVVTCMAVAAVASTYATQMTGSVTGGNTLTATPDSIVPQSDGKTYEWSDKAGDGSDVAADPGLDMATFNITRNDSSVGFTLDLDHTGDGSVGGSITNGGNLTASASWNNDAGPITITRARHVSVNNINVSSQNQNPGQLTVRHTGNFQGNIIYAETYGSDSVQGPTLLSGNQAGTQSVEDLRNTFGLSGYLTARQTGAMVRNLREITLENYWQVAIDGDTSGYSIYAPNVALRNGSAANVTITGIGVGGVHLRNPAGTAGGIFTGSTRTDDNWIVRLGSVVISTAGPVELHHLITGIPNGTQGSQYNPGNATITAAGDISISGTLHLFSPWRTPGTLVLTSTGGSIQVNDLMLNRMASAQFSAPGNSTITGVITGTDGNPASGLDNIGTGLRTPNGQKIYYKPDQNPDLNGQTYTLASLAGTAGAGGELKPLHPGGTVIRFR